MGGLLLGNFDYDLPLIEMGMVVNIMSINLYKPW